MEELPDTGPVATENLGRPGDPLGLVLTELLINANKHAYGGMAGPIDVALIEGRAHFQMIVSDRGTGVMSSQKGFGSRIMSSLVDQLGGKLAFTDNAPGLRAVLTVSHQTGTPTDLDLTGLDKANGHGLV